MKSGVTVSQDPIANLRQTFITSFKNGDVDAMISMFAEDATVMPPNDTTLYGRSEIKAWLEEYFEFFRINAVAETEREVKVAGDMAIEITGYMIAITPRSGGARIRDDGRGLVLWTRQPDGQWQATHWIWNSIKPIGAGTSRFLARLSQKKKDAPK